MKKNKKKLTIISFNAMSAFSFNTFRGFFNSIDIPSRIKKTTEILAKEDPDIILLQEIHFYPVLNYLTKKLSKFKYSAYKKYIAGPRGGLLILSKLPIENTDYQNFTKRGSMTNSSFVAHIIKNGILSCKLKDLPIYILNTHLTPNLDFSWTETNRFYNYISSQLNQLSGLVNKISQKNFDIIVGGDLNTSKNSALYKRFVKNSKLLDPFKKYTFPTLHQDFLSNDKNATRIDYIFYKPTKNILSVSGESHLFTEKYNVKKMKFSHLSDHIGLKVSFEIK